MSTIGLEVFEKPINFENILNVRYNWFSQNYNKLIFSDNYSNVDLFLNFIENQSELIFGGPCSKYDDFIHLSAKSIQIKLLTKQFFWKNKINVYSGMCVYKCIFKRNIIILILDKNLIDW